MPDVRILIIDDDESSQRALRFILDAEGWELQVAAMPEQALAHLAKGGWNLVIANVSMSSLGGPLFSLLKDLAEGGGAVRVLFLVPALAEPQARDILEKLKLPYVTKPVQLLDFLERVGELLFEAGALKQPLRRVRGPGPAAPERRLADRRKQKAGSPPMFASREDYFDYDEEELRRYEEEERRKKEGEGGSESG